MINKIIGYFKATMKIKNSSLFYEGAVDYVRFFLFYTKGQLNDAI